MDPSYSKGFETQENEVENRKLEVEGEIPSWVSGSLYRNGPAVFEVDGSEVDHWFDGLAMVNRFRFSNSEIYYTNRLLRSDAYNKVMENGFQGGFATGTSLIDKLKMIISDPPDNANVNIARMGGRHVALTESPGWVEFDPATLETLARLRFQDELNLQQVGAHVQHDDQREETIGYGVSYGKDTQYVFYRMRDSSRKREEISRIDVDMPSYQHSFGLTENYILMTEIPFEMNPIKAILSSEGFIQNFNWKPGKGTRIAVIDRETGEIIHEEKIEAFFTFHHVNAFEEGEEIVMDLIEYPDERIINTLFLKELDEGAEDVPDGELSRYRIDLEGGLKKKKLYKGIELPAYNPDRHMKKYRYAYGQATSRNNCDGLVMVDTETGDKEEWWEEGVHMQEPKMVPSPDGDGGVLVSLGLDREEETSMLLVLDSKTMEEKARAYLPFHIPFGFHGEFFNDL